MRFVFTLNLPSKHNPVHEVIGEYPAASLKEMHTALEKSQWGIIINQFYLEQNKLTPRGQMLLNSMIVGKVKIFVEY